MTKFLEAKLIMIIRYKVLVEIYIFLATPNFLSCQWKMNNYKIN